MSDRTTSIGGLAAAHGPDLQDEAEASSRAQPDRPVTSASSRAEPAGLQSLMRRRTSLRGSVGELLSPVATAIQRRGAGPGLPICVNPDARLDELLPLLAVSPRDRTLTGKALPDGRVALRWVRGLLGPDQDAGAQAVARELLVRVIRSTFEGLAPGQRTPAAGQVVDEVCDDLSAPNVRLDKTRVTDLLGEVGEAISSAATRGLVTRADDPVPTKTPTECFRDLLDALRAAGPAAATLRERVEERWMQGELDSAGTIAFLDEVAQGARDPWPDIAQRATVSADGLRQQLVKGRLLTFRACLEDVRSALHANNRHADAIRGHVDGALALGDRLSDPDDMAAVLQGVADEAGDALPDIEQRARAGIEELRQSDAAGGFPLTRLHDNEPARRWESRWVDAAVAAPSNEFLSTSHALGLHWLALVEEMEQVSAERFGSDAEALMANMPLEHSPPVWLDDHPQLVELVSLHGSPRFIPRLKEMLRTPPANGIEALGLYFLGTSIDLHSLVMFTREHEGTRWDDLREELRNLYIEPREDPQSELVTTRRHTGVPAPESGAVGVSLYGQRPVALGRSRLRAVSARITDLGSLDDEARRPLESGRPKAASVSGHLLYGLTKLNTLLLQGHENIDPANALLAQMFLMVKGGAHTIQEMLKTIQLVLARLPGLARLPLMRDAAAGRVPSYRDLIDLLGRHTPSAVAVQAAGHRAWEDELSGPAASGVTPDPANLG